MSRFNAQDPSPSTLWSRLDDYFYPRRMWPKYMIELWWCGELTFESYGVSCICLFEWNVSLVVFKINMVE